MNDEYDRLAKESSDLLIKGDANKAAGRYEKAARLRFDAAVMRHRMAEIRLHGLKMSGVRDLGAMEDLIEAVSCILDALSLKEM